MSENETHDAELMWESTQRWQPEKKWRIDCREVLFIIFHSTKSQVRSENLDMFNCIIINFIDK